MIYGMINPEMLRTYGEIRRRQQMNDRQIACFLEAVKERNFTKVAEKLDMVDNSADVSKTFNDYQEESAMTLMRMYIPKGHNWENHKICEVSIPTGALALMIKRDGDTMIPNGDTRILAEDSVILSVPAYESKEDEHLEEVLIEKNNPWCEQRIRELNLPQNQLIALVKRGEENLIPSGSTKIHEGDIVVLYR